MPPWWRLTSRHRVVARLCGRFVLETSCGPSDAPPEPGEAEGRDGPPCSRPNHAGPLPVHPLESVAAETGYSATPPVGAPPLGAPARSGCLLLPPPGPFQQPPDKPASLETRNRHTTADLRANIRP